MNKIITSICVLFMLTSCGAQKKSKISGNKQVVTINKDIDELFDFIDIDDGLEVTVRQSNKDSYLLTADENLVGVITVAVRENTLYIATTKRITSSKKLNIYLNVNSFKGVNLKNGASLESDGLLNLSAFALTGHQDSSFELDLETESFEINLLDNSEGDVNVRTDEATIIMNGRSDLDCKLKTDELTIALEKNAELSLNGNADEAKITVNSSANLKAQRFEVDDAEINMADRANVSIEVSDNLTLFGKDKSTLNLYGSPELNVKGLSDKSSINKK